jgi:cell pole-organizing protein PopZ
LHVTLGFNLAGVVAPNILKLVLAEVTQAAYTRLDHSVDLISRLDHSVELTAPGIHRSRTAALPAAPACARSLAKQSSSKPAFCMAACTQQQQQQQDNNLAAVQCRVSAYGDRKAASSQLSCVQPQAKHGTAHQIPAISQ